MVMEYLISKLALETTLTLAETGKKKRPIGNYAA